MINMTIEQENSKVEIDLEEVGFRPTSISENKSTQNKSEVKEKENSEKPKIKLKILLQIGVNVSNYCQCICRQPYYRINGVA
jgi:hypothetical protein